MAVILWKKNPWWQPNTPENYVTYCQNVISTEIKHTSLIANVLCTVAWPWKPPVWSNNHVSISYISRVLANFVLENHQLVTMVTRVGLRQISTTPLNCPTPKTPTLVKPDPENGVDLWRRLLKRVSWVYRGAGNVTYRMILLVSECMSLSPRTY